MQHFKSAAPVEPLMRPWAGTITGPAGMQCEQGTPMQCLRLMHPVHGKGKMKH